jgi:hypothetical protein
MSIASRLGLLALAAGACLALYQWDLVGAGPKDLTRAALRQFENSDAAAEDLRVADAAKHWWPLATAVGLGLLAALLFWDDLERVSKASGIRGEDRGSGIEDRQP